MNILTGSILFAKKLKVNLGSDAGFAVPGMNIAVNEVVALRPNDKGEERKQSSRFMIKTKRVYEKPTASDGIRLLIDRVWPRGLKKEELALDAWLKDVAPSERIRKWFGHDPRKWTEFRRRYFAELRGKTGVWTAILEKARKSNVTLLYGARDTEHNNAAALRDFLNVKLRRQRMDT
jgi:uncharacterized protein YeaO (DUF488 family)